MVLSMEKWVGKVAVVTGASVGIGATIAEKLVGEGLLVVGIARRVNLIKDQAEHLSDKKGKLFALEADLTKEGDIIRGLKWIEKNIGPIHILINNAGFLTETTLIDGDINQWKTALNINVLALCIATSEAIKYMISNKVEGHIIHINSIAGHKVVNLPNCSVYPATKHAVTALTEGLRMELNSIGSNIKITSVSPGFVVSEMTTLSPTASNDRRRLMESVPILSPEDIADGIVYVLSTPPGVQVHELMIKPTGEPE